MKEQHEEEQEFSFKSLFIPLTTIKAIRFIIIISMTVFSNGFFNDFVGDDKGQIVNNTFHIGSVIGRRIG